MMEKSDSTKHIREQLLQELKQHDGNAQVQIKRTSSGWLYLYITTSSFEGQTQIEREQQVDAILTKLDLTLGGYPFADYRLQTPQEASEQEPFHPVQVPLWSEILMAPEPDTPAAIDEDTTKRPFVVTFYSFKGGVGRSTALGFVANILATYGRRVVMIDFDLEAPGLSFIFPLEASVPEKYGVLDYLYQRSLTPDLNEPKMADCIRQIDTSTRGELYIVPAGEYDEGYIHRLADLDIRLLYRSATNPIHQLLDDVKACIDPDIILIDARTGFTEMGAIALFDRTDLGVICFSPTDQSFAGLQWVVKAAKKQRSYNGIPDLRFLLTPMPPVAQSQQQIWTNRTADWIADNWEIPASLTVEEIYYQVPYNPSITTLTNLIGEMPPGILDAYMSVANAITASLSEKQLAALKIVDSRQIILSELKFLAAAAQEIDAATIPIIFQRTVDFYKFLQDRTWLVRGAKGTGKTLLFRLFVERAADARNFAEPDVNLRNVQFIPGHGQAGLRPTLLTSTDLGSYEQQVGKDAWNLFWLNYLLLQMVVAIPELQSLSILDPKLIALCRQEESQHSDIVAWLVRRAQSPQLAPQANDELRTIDQWLQQHNQKTWLLYDELDIGFQDLERRRRAIEGLLSWWVENGSVLKSIAPKILLREDIWMSLNFTNKAYFSGRFVQLRWEEEDLWRLILRQALNESSVLATVIGQQLGVGIEDLNNIGKEQLRKSLYPLWGEQMGRVNKAYTHNWVRNRISDGKKNHFPRSLIQLLQKAVEIEKGFTEQNPYETVLRPRALIDALPFVSEQRVAEIRDEYREFDNFLDKLSGEQSPITLDRLESIWEKDSDELKSLVASMVEAGILQEYLRTSDIGVQRYSIPELYLYGLGMERQGQYSGPEEAVLRWAEEALAPSHQVSRPGISDRGLDMYFVDRNGETVGVEVKYFTDPKRTRSSISPIISRYLKDEIRPSVGKLILVYALPEESSAREAASILPKTADVPPTVSFITGYLQNGEFHEVLTPTN